MYQSVIHILDILCTLWLQLFGHTQLAAGIPRKLRLFIDITYETKFLGSAWISSEMTAIVNIISTSIYNKYHSQRKKGKRYDTCQSKTCGLYYGPIWLIVVIAQNRVRVNNARKSNNMQIYFVAAY